MAFLSEQKSFPLSLLTHRCIGCGGRIKSGKSKFCAWCLIRMYPDGERWIGGQHVFTGFLHAGVVREMILRFKFDGERHLNRELALLTLSVWREAPSASDTVIAVPVSRRRFRQRGYNQAGLLAKAICRETGAVYKNILVRKSGQSQIEVPGASRVDNIRGKFALKPGSELKGKVWLIDDVMTTGSTITEIVSTLSDAGISEVQPGVVCFRKLDEESIIPCKEVYHARVREC